MIGSVLFLAQFFDFTMIGSLILRRLLFVPAHLNFTYLEYFSQNEFVYWSNSMMKNIVNYPYDLQPTQVIGSYLGYENMAANTGFVASGFMHAGYLGVILYTLILIFLLNIINNLSRGVSQFLVLSIIYVALHAAFISSDLLTALLTHGLLVSIFVLWLYEDKMYILKFGRIKYKV